MKPLTVTAAGSPLFGQMLFVVSVVHQDGTATSNLTASDFNVHFVASHNHAFTNEVKVTEVKEGAKGVYIVSTTDSAGKRLPAGHYVYAITVSKVGFTTELRGQTVAVGDFPDPTSAAIGASGDPARP